MYGFVLVVLVIMVSRSGFCGLRLGVRFCFFEIFELGICWVGFRRFRDKELEWENGKTKISF